MKWKTMLTEVLIETPEGIVREIIIQVNKRIAQRLEEEPLFIARRGRKVGNKVLDSLAVMLCVNHDDEERQVFDQIWLLAQCYATVDALGIDDKERILPLLLSLPQEITTAEVGWTCMTQYAGDELKIEGTVAIKVFVVIEDSCAEAANNMRKLFIETTTASTIVDIDDAIKPYFEVN